MKKFNDHYFTEEVNKFRIPKSIKGNYKIKGDMSNVKNWKVKIILGNNLSSKENKKVGDWDGVGYVMIATKSNNIIPIARSDEHQTGYDLIEHLQDKKLIKEEPYTPIYTLSQDYIYSDHKDHLENKLNIYKKFLEYGGNNIKVDDSNSNYIGTIEDIIARNGNVKIKKGEVMPFGRKIIDSLDEIATLLTKILKSPNESLIHKLNDKALSFLENNRFILMVELDIDNEFIDTLNIDINKNYDEYNIVDKGFFGMNGIKNQIHKNIKQAIKNPNDYSSKGIAKIFGDITKANNEFNRLGNI